MTHGKDETFVLVLYFMTLLDGSIEESKIIQVTSDTGCSNICWYLLINSNTPQAQFFSH